MAEIKYEQDARGSFRVLEWPELEDAEYETLDELEQDVCRCAMQRQFTRELSSMLNREQVPAWLNVQLAKWRAAGDKPTFIVHWGTYPQPNRLTIMTAVCQQLWQQKDDGHWRMIDERI
jgi:hypothetical protein